MTEATGARSFHDAAARAAPLRAIGAVTEIAGSASQILLNLETVNTLTNDPDPAIAAAGQIGSQVKIRAGGNWLIANVRAIRAAPEEERQALATIDFLGEADEDRTTGGLHGFRRGVTRYPMPGTPVYPLATADLHQMYGKIGKNARFTHRPRDAFTSFGTVGNFRNRFADNLIAHDLLNDAHSGN